MPHDDATALGMLEKKKKKKKKKKRKKKLYETELAEFVRTIFSDVCSHR